MINRLNMSTVFNEAYLNEDMVFKYTHTNIHTYINIYVCVYIFVHVYVCVYECMCVYLFYVCVYLN